MYIACVHLVMTKALWEGMFWEESKEWWAGKGRQTYTLNSVTSPFAAAPVTEDMLVTHFLIQPDPEGVKLQGWNERAFSEY